ncbi:hypothetical protein G6F61_005309 [Rhizopus arrhizus]|nr:hypothetical protein G6F61_005309 [Rhizopus arrhizus]
MSTNRGRKPSVLVLSSEQIQWLYKQFEFQRGQLVCLNCQETNSFYRHGTTADSSPQPSFIYAMEITISFDANAVPPTATIASLQATIEKLYAKLKQTQVELKQARDEIEALCIHGPQASTCPSSRLIGSQFPYLPPAYQFLPPWKNAARLQNMKQSMLEKSQRRLLQKQENVARFLQPLSENQDFQYIYIPTKARIPIGQLQSCLRKLVTNNSCGPIGSQRLCL